MVYEELEDEICKEGVEIIHMKFKGRFKGLYGDNVIAIDPRIETHRERKCVLVEEIGHHYKTIGDITDNTKIENRKQEKLARNWGYEKLVGIRHIIQAHEHGCKTAYEIAEYLDVTQEFLEEAIQHYREKHGMLAKIDNYAVYFEPGLGVLKMF